MLRMSAAVDAGIHRDTLRKMVASGDLQKISRGLYQMVEAAPLPYPDLAVVAAKVPEGVICLISALSFHNLTTQIPHEVYLAIGRNSEPPRIGYPPVRVFRFSGKTFTEGVEEHASGPYKVHVYSREKTIADCFKFRNKLGLDTVLEAVRMYKQSRHTNVDALLHYADICRVAKVMRPYLEAML
jgi:predicted transcriptional regulator of viral defense system